MEDSPFLWQPEEIRSIFQPFKKEGNTAVGNKGEPAGHHAK